MSKEIAKKLIIELETNEELKARVEGVTDPKELLNIAAEAGYDVTEAEMLEAEREFKKALAEKTDEKLSFDDLEAVAGGGDWHGEDAPDGHEMGCYICYHKKKYSEETGNYCTDQFYCTGEARGDCVELASLCNQQKLCSTHARM